jgi:hypothetical protein
MTLPTWELNCTNRNQAAGLRDTLDEAAKWSAALVANGKVFVGTNARLTVYPLLP